MKNIGVTIAVLTAAVLTGCGAVATQATGITLPSDSPSPTVVHSVPTHRTARVPNVVGATGAHAIARLRAAGFAPITSRRMVTSGPNGVVLAEGPVPGTVEGSGARVRIVISRLVAPPPPPRRQQVAPTHSCTTTSSGTCIRGGEFCRRDEYGMTGYDAEGRAYTCTGDSTHPHWE